MVVLALSALGPIRAVAAGQFSPFANATVEHDSNVFYLPGPGADGIASLGDVVSKFTAGFNTQYDWGRDNASLYAEGLRELYDRFGYLDHYEYALNGQVDWHFGPVLETVLSYAQSRAMANFADTLTTVAELDTTRNAQLTARILVAPEWRLSLAPRDFQQQIPLPQYPDFRLKESGGTADFDYLGLTNVTGGLEIGYTHGAYQGIANATKYDQRAAALTATYKVTDKSNFTGNVGYTVRDSSLNPQGSTVFLPGANQQAGSTAAVTSNLSYNLQLTSKTQLTLQLFRSIDSYVAGANAELSKGGSAAIRWSPDFRFTLELDYREEWEDFAGDLVIANFADRSDRMGAGEFDVSYFATSRLTVRTFVMRNNRESNFEAARYSKTVAGLEIRGKLN